jgi:hypothetical protein
MLLFFEPQYQHAHQLALIAIFISLRAGDKMISALPRIHRGKDPLQPV